MRALTLVGLVMVALIASMSGGNARSAITVQSSDARCHNLAVSRRLASSSERRPWTSSNALMKRVTLDAVSRTHLCRRSCHSNRISVAIAAVREWRYGGKLRCLECDVLVWFRIVWMPWMSSPWHWPWFIPHLCKRTGPHSDATVVCWGLLPTPLHTWVPFFINPSSVCPWETWSLLKPGTSPHSACCEMRWWSIRI